VLGCTVADRLVPDEPVSGVTTGKRGPELRTLSVPNKVGGGSIDSEARVPCDGREGAARIEADRRCYESRRRAVRWGIVGKGEVTMRGPGRKTERPFSREESAALGETATQLLGPVTVDVYLNDSSYWRNVPRRVWAYTLGGCQVLKKWLSYREQAILGRPLPVDEVGYVTQVARRIAALVLLGPDLDENYRRAKANTYAFAGHAR